MTHAFDIKRGETSVFCRKTILVFLKYPVISGKNEILWSQAKLFHLKMRGGDFGSATGFDLAIFATFLILGINVLMQVMIKLIDSYCSPNCF